MSMNRSGAPAFKEKKSISIAALIVCFVIACGIWLYAQAIDDDIKVKTYNQLPVEVIGADVFLEATGYDVHSLAVQNADIKISGINRELVKYDAQSIRLVADVGAANNGVATVKAYYVDEDGNKTELKNYEVTPAVVTVNVIKQIPYTVQDVTPDRNEQDYTYIVDQTSMAGSFSIIGPLQDVALINNASFDLDYHAYIEKEGTYFVHVSAVSFYNENNEPLAGESNKIENIKYDSTGITVKVEVLKNDTEPDSQGGAKATDPNG